MVFFPGYDPVYPLFLDGHQALDLGSTLSQYDTILTSCFYRLYFQMRLHSEVLVGQDFFWEEDEMVG